MYSYTIPSKSVYCRRKQFHSNQRNKDESTDEWCRRVFESLNGCEFGEYADFMFIDKFFAGLDTETFDQCAPEITLTVDKAFSIGLEHKNHGNDFEIVSALESSDDIRQNPILIDHINVEVSTQN